MCKIAFLAILQYVYYTRLYDSYLNTTAVHDVHGHYIAVSHNKYTLHTCTQL